MVRSRAAGSSMPGPLGGALEKVPVSYELLVAGVIGCGAIALGVNAYLRFRRGALARGQFTDTMLFAGIIAILAISQILRAPIWRWFALSAGSLLLGLYLGRQWERGSLPTGRFYASMAAWVGLLAAVLIAMTMLR